MPGCLAEVRPGRSDGLAGAVVGGHCPGAATADEAKRLGQLGMSLLDEVPVMFARVGIHSHHVLDVGRAGRFNEALRGYPAWRSMKRGSAEKCRPITERWLDGGSVRGGTVAGLVDGGAPHAGRGNDVRHAV
jgi:hypothetical protein